MIRSRKALAWTVAVCGVVVAAAALAGWHRDRDPSLKAFHTYLETIRRGNAEGAFHQLCPSAQESLLTYRESLDATLTFLGEPIRIAELGASRPRRGVALLIGSQGRLIVSIDIIEINGTWRPCPTEGPLGSVRTPRR